MKIPKLSKLKGVGLTGLRVAALAGGLALGSGVAMPQQLSTGQLIGGTDCTDNAQTCPQSSCGEYVTASGEATESYTACTDGVGCTGFSEERCSTCACCW